jgi:hypothetical protein
MLGRANRASASKPLPSRQWFSEIFGEDAGVVEFDAFSAVGVFAVRLTRCVTSAERAVLMEHLRACVPSMIEGPAPRSRRFVDGQLNVRPDRRGGS